MQPLDDTKIRLEGVTLDLLKLSFVKALAQLLLSRGQPIDAVIWNAGMSGWLGIHYPRAIWSLCTDLLHASTYPDYFRVQIGLLADKQDPTDPSEPALGQIFLANVFGHYMLTHWLAPLLGRESRVIWTTSGCAFASSFEVADLQCIAAPLAYEATKRLTDIFVLTSELPSTAVQTNEFLATEKAEAKPKMFLTHPGVCATAIVGLHWSLSFFIVATMYIARWLGSPWHTTSAYKGATSAVFAALAPSEQLAAQEAYDGKGKWGSAVSVAGDERVARTDVEGWGFGGVVGEVPAGSVASGVGRRERSAKLTTREMREQFEEDGRVVWREMERLRVLWESRLGGPPKA